MWPSKKTRKTRYLRISYPIVLGENHAKHTLSSRAIQKSLFPHATPPPPPPSPSDFFHVAGKILVLVWLFFRVISWNEVYKVNEAHQVPFRTSFDDHAIFPRDLSDRKLLAVDDEENTSCAILIQTVLRKPRNRKNTRFIRSLKLGKLRVVVFFFFFVYSVKSPREKVSIWESIDRRTISR